MFPLLVREVRADRPVAIDRMLHATGYVNAIRRLVIRIDQISRCAGSSLQASSPNQRVSPCTSCERAWSRRHIARVYPLKSRRPSVLREIIEEHPKSGADHRFPAIAGRVRDPDPWPELLPIIVRDAGNKWNLQRPHRDKRRIEVLTVT